MWEVARRVSRDCLVSFEGRRYSVPFAWAGQWVDVRGTAREVVVRGGGQEIARHRRGTRALLLLDESHYEGPSTDRVIRPTPLGRRGRCRWRVARRAGSGRLRSWRRGMGWSVAVGVCALGGVAGMRAGRVDLDVVAERCRELGLLQTAEQLPELLEEASREDLTPVRFLERLVEREYERKEERRIGMWLRMRSLSEIPCVGGQ